ncbi:MAG: SUMF1/EgtB/PvdO family nonheme iron enzyme [Pseudonocardiaceae bacterium]
MYEGMALIPADRATIGSPSEHLDAVTALSTNPRVWFEDEAPQHTREVRAFYLDNHPVTNTRFADFVLSTGYVTHAERSRSIPLVRPTRWGGKQPPPCATVSTSLRGTDLPPPVVFSVVDPLAGRRRG